MITEIPTAITVGPRRQRDTLAEVLALWPAAGLRKPRLIVDGARPLPPGYETTVRDLPVGAWPTWLAALRELVDREPLQPAFCVFQDDAAPARNLAPFVDETWPADAQVLSLATVDTYAAGEPGWHSRRGRFGMAGAQAIILTQNAARNLLCDAAAASYRWDCDRKVRWQKKDGRAHVDGVIGEWAGRAGLPVWRHTPSLVGHLAPNDSTLHPTAGEKASRTTNTWPGGHFDLKNLEHR